MRFPQKITQASPHQRLCTTKKRILVCKYPKSFRNKVTSFCCKKSLGICKIKSLFCGAQSLMWTCLSNLFWKAHLLHFATSKSFRNNDCFEVSLRFSRKHPSLQCAIFLLFLRIATDSTKTMTMTKTSTMAKNIDNSF